MNEKIIDLTKLKGVKRTTGQHPGGLLIVPNGIEIEDFTPLNYPADNKKIDVITTHFEYNFLSSENFLKIDILGHDEPTVLQVLRKKTKSNLSEESNFQDKKIMKIFTTGKTLGIPEFGTDSTIRMLILLKPNKFSQLVKISGFSHGTNVWNGNQKNFFKDKKIDFDELIACREDIIDCLIANGIKNKEAFLISEYIRKGNIEKIPENLKELLKNNLQVSEKGKYYLRILEKITYIFPRPHAIAYTMMAWRIAYYKVYYNVDFFSVLLTYHVVVYDIWLMSLKEELAIFRIENIFKKNSKNREKDLIFIFTVIEILKSAKNTENYDNFFLVVEKKFLELMEISDIEKKIKDKIKKIKNEKNFERIRKATAREKELIFSLKVAMEIKETFELKQVVNLNKSEASDFLVEDNCIYYPFSSISGIGEKIAEKIIEYRKTKGQITKNWKEDLRSVINQNHMDELQIMENKGLVEF